jgi:hypothetical protein
MKKTLTILLGCLFFISTAACDKDEEESSSSSKKEEEISSGDQPDAEEGRFSVPTDTTAPPSPNTFAAVKGENLGEVKLVIQYPEHVGDYDRIEVMRLPGPTAPADCESGELAMTITDFEETEFVDTGLYPGKYAYRACVYDEAENYVEAAAISVGQAGDQQRMFVTSDQYDGNLAATFDT